MSKQTRYGVINIIETIHSRIYAATEEVFVLPNWFWGVMIYNWPMRGNENDMRLPKQTISNLASTKTYFEPATCFIYHTKLCIGLRVNSGNKIFCVWNNSIWGKSWQKHVKWKHHGLYSTCVGTAMAVVLLLLLLLLIYTSSCPAHKHLLLCLIPRLCHM